MPEHRSDEGIYRVMGVKMFENWRSGGSQFIWKRGWMEKFLQMGERSAWSCSIIFIQQDYLRKQLLKVIKHRFNPTDPMSPAPADPNEMSPGLALSSILKRVEENMEAKLAKMLEAKTTDIVDFLSSTMESILNKVKSQIDDVKERSARYGQILADELMILDDSVSTQINTFQTQMKSLFDDVKKGKVELILRSAGMKVI